MVTCLPPKGQWEPDIQTNLSTYLDQIYRLSGAIDLQPDLEVRLIEEEDWAAKWLPFFRPLKIGTIWITSSEINVPLKEGEQKLTIDPGQAFGTGRHETTHMCMEAIVMLNPFMEKGAPLLDLGTGSGILAMFAAKNGFTDILALDIDPVAIATARENIRKNGLEKFIKTENRALNALKRRFSLILANLTGPLLLGLSKDIKNRLDQGGRLVASGFLQKETNAMMQSFSLLGLTPVYQGYKNDWGCVIMRNK